MDIVCMFVWVWLAFCTHWGYSSILPVFLAPSFSLALHLPHSHSLSSVYPCGDLCWLKQFAPGTSFAVRKVKRQSGGERVRKTERAAGEATCDGGRCWEKWDMHHLPIDTLPSWNQSEWLSKYDRDAVRKLQWRELDEQHVGKVKRLLWILY